MEYDPQSGRMSNGDPKSRSLEECTVDCDRMNNAAPRSGKPIHHAKDYLHLKFNHVINGLVVCDEAISILLHGLGWLSHDQ
jgi:hypothetical protein